ncbi:MAG: hypothetical protein IKH57_19010 [Clostridia bacterium]|nr:hypothetical protein [Clostridia bacterium]
MTRKLTIPEWHAMAQAGAPIPMRIPIHGVSMYPLIRMDRDFVTIMPLEERPQIGDIVLFANLEKKQYVLHRVWQTQEDCVLTWGDNCDHPDGWMPWDVVWGKAVLVERGKWNITPDPKKGLILARVWHKLGRIYRWCVPRVKRVKRWLNRMIKRGGGHGESEKS